MQRDGSVTAGQRRTRPCETLHEACARQAHSHPGKVALISGANRVTYEELNRTADAWAADLVAQGVRPGEIIPILLPRGVNLVIAVLSTLKAGAAYALLDPAWPAGRLRAATDDLASRLLITDRTDADVPARTVWRPPAEPATAPAKFAPARTAGAQPCAVFFTSGTTGRPKAVLTPHRALARLFHPGGVAHFSNDVVMPLATQMPWDAFSFELWSALFNGGTSLIIDEPYLSAGSLQSGVSRHGVNTVWLTSSLFNMIVDEAPEAFRGLRRVIIGGERLSAAHTGRFLTTHPSITLLNGYGPVESTVFATTHRITQADCRAPGGIPLGRPIQGSWIHVLDGQRPCGSGEEGEICISGDGLALGYLGESATKPSNFIELDCDGKPERVYRTGDLGAWDEEGLLHFRGRADRQLKVRGHRIEPAEIEREVLRLLPSARACRVLAQPDDVGAARGLLAFCVPAEPGDELADAVSLLRSELPVYQQPAMVVSVDAFPVTTHGKLDEPALLAMAAEATLETLADSPDGPAHRTTQLVVETFQDVLGRNGIPVDTPFVQLGGSSLDAGRVCARLTTRLRRPIPVSKLYAHDTATRFADWLRTTAPSATPDLTHSGTLPSDEVSLTPMQLTHLVRGLADPDDRTGHCLLSWIIDGDLDRAALESAIDVVHQRHESLRARYVPDPAPTACPVDVPAPVLELLPAESSVEGASVALRTELGDELDLDAATVWRTVLIPIGTGSKALFGCVVHHVAFDGWSESVLATDLATAYNTGTGGDLAPPSLATVRRQQADVATHTDLAAQHDYLSTELAGTPELDWPMATVKRAAPDPDLVEATLTPETVAEVDAVAADTGVSRFSVLLSCYARGLADVTGQDDFAVGVPVAQRYSADMENTVGCHINMLCIRLRHLALQGNAAAARETGRVVGRALSAQDVSFWDVLELVQPPRTRRPPLFQTLFALQDNPSPHLDLDGVSTSFLRQPYLDLPLELHTELWPQPDGGIALTVYFRPNAVGESTVEELTKRFIDTVHAMQAGAQS